MRTVTCSDNLWLQCDWVADYPLAFPLRLNVPIQRFRCAMEMRFSELTIPGIPDPGWSGLIGVLSRKVVKVGVLGYRAAGVG